MSFFKRVLDAIKNFDKYEDFSLEKVTTSLKYFAKLILLFAIVTSLVFNYKFYDLSKQAISYFKTEIPELTFKDGSLNIESEEPIFIENEESMVSMIVIDTGSEEKLDEYRSKVDLFGDGIIILKDRIIIRNKLLSNELTYDYKTIAQNYGISNFDKKMAENYLTNLTKVSTYIVVFVVSGIYMFIVYILSSLLDALMLGVLAWLLAKISAIKMEFKNAFNIGVYALTLSIILNMIYIVVNQLTGFTISNFQWMYSIISYIYVFIAILIIRTDLINRQLELIKLQEEQEKVRKELNQEQEQQEQEQEKKNKEKKEKNKKEEDKKDDGKQPDGVQA